MGNPNTLNVRSNDSNFEARGFVEYERLKPAGEEFMRETPRIAHNLGEVACEISLQGSSDADGTGTTNSMDPDTMDPRALFDTTTEYIPGDHVSLN